MEEARLRHMLCGSLNMGLMPSSIQHMPMAKGGREELLPLNANEGKYGKPKKGKHVFLARAM